MAKLPNASQRLIKSEVLPKTTHIVLVAEENSQFSDISFQIQPILGHHSIHTVHTPHQLEAVLDTGEIKLVITEFPGTSITATQVLKACNHSPLDLSVLALGERPPSEQVVDWLQHSTTYYSEQSNFARIEHVIRNTVPQLTAKSTLESVSTAPLPQQEAPSFFNTIGIISVSAEGDISEANDVFLTMLGYSRQDLLQGKLNWRHLTPPEYSTVDDIALAQILKYGKAAPIEKPYIHQDGHWVYVSIVPAFVDISKSVIICFVLELPGKNLLQGVEKLQRDLFFQGVDLAFIGMLRTREDGSIIEANQTFLNLLGYTQNDIAQQTLNWRKITPPEFLPQDDEPRHLFQAKGEAPAFEKQYIHKDGHRIDVLVARIYREKEDPSVNRVFIIDISNLKYQERAFEEVRNNLEEAQRMAKIGSWDFKLPEREAYHSEEFYRILGAPSGTPLSTRKDFLPYVHPEDHNAWNQAIDRSLAGDAYSTAYRVIRPDGMIRHVFVQGEVIRNDQGEVIRMYGTMQDVTEHRCAEEALMRITIQQEALLNNIPDMVWMKDTEFKLIAANQSAAQAVGSNKDSILGKTFFELLPLEQAQQYHETDQQVLKSKQQCIVEYQKTQADGSTLWIEVIKSPILNNENEVIGLTAIARDITNRKKYESTMLRSNELLENKVKERTAELEAANQTLKENERLRSTFVSSLTHDLRTPLIAQKRLVELLADQCPESAEKMRFLCSGLMQNNENLLEMVSKLLEAYQYAEGKILLQLQTFNLHQLIEECYDSLREVARTKNIQLLNPISQFSITADRSLLKRVLINLIGNALENISNNCFIQVEAEHLNNQFVLKVRDNGGGIEPEFLPYMFDRFAPRSRRRQKLGSGLGLFICKTIVELHQGTISVESKVGKGALFIISLPPLKSHSSS